MYTVTGTLLILYGRKKPVHSFLTVKVCLFWTLLSLYLMLFICYMLSGF